MVRRRWMVAVDSLTLYLQKSLMLYGFNMDRTNA